MQQLKQFDTCVSIFFCLMVSAVFGKVIKVVDDIEKLDTDKRLFRGLELSNGLKAVIVSDPETDSAAAALNLAVGSMSDPWEAQGMAHFTEHMLFMGTEKYPEEDDYSKFITSHGGRFNAMTGMQETVYFFSIDREFLESILDRFAQFFVAPLFSASAVEREVNAVNSEYSKNYNIDFRKIFMVQKILSKPGHDFGKFSVGSKETLFDIPKSKGIDPRDLVVQFYDKWYSANLMTLTVVGKESLDVLTEWVDTKFSAIRNRNVSEPKWDYPFGPCEFHQIIKIKTILDDSKLQIAYPVTNLEHGYTEEILRYLTYTLDDKGKGSLAAHLSSLGWSKEYYLISAQISTGFGVTEISLFLTEEGTKHVEETIEIVTQYIKLLSSAGPQEATYRELDVILKNKFMFKEKEDPIHLVTTLCTGLKKYNMNMVLKGDYVMKDYNPKAIEIVLKKFTPENMAVFLISSKFDNELDKIETRYNTSYSVEKFKPEFISKLSKISNNPALKLPGPNEFADVETCLKPRDPTMGDVPELVDHDSMMDVWYYQDQTFHTLEASVFVRLSTPTAGIDPIHNFVLSVLSSEINRLFQLNLYSAHKAGLKSVVHKFDHGLTISVEGNTESIELLLMKIFDIIIDFHGDPQRFKIFKTQEMNSLKNKERGGSLRVAQQYFGVLLKSQTWTLHQKSHDLERMEFSDFERILPILLQQFHIDVFGCGNVDREQISNIARKVKWNLISQSGAQPFPLSSIQTKRAVQLFKGENKVFIKQHKTEKDSGVIMFMQANQTSVLNTLLAHILEQMATQPIFHDLRTKQQLGYSVYTSAIELYGLIGFQVSVQSSKCPQYVASRIDNSLLLFRTKLIEMTNDDFQVQKKGYESKTLNTITQFSTQKSMWWEEIKEAQYNFHRRGIEKSTLTNITKQQVIDFFDAYVNPLSKTRSRLNIWIVGKDAQDAGFSFANVCNNASMPTCIVNEIEFKEEHTLFPNEKPFTTVEELQSTQAMIAAAA